MPRPSTFATVFFSLCALALFAGCTTRTIYSDMYSPRRNYFKPVKEQPRPTEVLPDGGPVLPSVPVAPPPAAPPDVPPPAALPDAAAPPSAL